MTAAVAHGRKLTTELLIKSVIVCLPVSMCLSLNAETATTRVVYLACSATVSARFVHLFDLT